jgi:hypothetical protein
MAAPDGDQGTERPLGDLAQSVSEQAVVLARQQVDLARRELTAKARQAGTGAALMGGAGFLGVLASGTGTAAVVLLLAGRPRASAAALGVAAAYGGTGALMAREGLVRLREAAPPVPVEAVESTKKNLGSAKRGAKPRPKPAAGSKPRAPRKQPERTRRQSS